MWNWFRANQSRAYTGGKGQQYGRYWNSVIPSAQDCCSRAGNISTDMLPGEGARRQWWPRVWKYVDVTHLAGISSSPNSWSFGCRVVVVVVYGGFEVIRIRFEVIPYSYGSGGSAIQLLHLTINIPD
jgi:hypothetical protein